MSFLLALGGNRRAPGGNVLGGLLVDALLEARAVADEEERLEPDKERSHDERCGLLSLRECKDKGEQG